MSRYYAAVVQRLLTSLVSSKITIPFFKIILLYSDMTGQAIFKAIKKSEIKYIDDISVGFCAAKEIRMKYAPWLETLCNSIFAEVK